MFIHRPTKYKEDDLGAFIVRLNLFKAFVINPEAAFCSCCGGIRLQEPLVMKLGDFFRYVKQTVFPFSGFNCSSGYRCQWHNRDIGGHDSSHHMNGSAVDLRLPNPEKYLDFLKDNIKLPRIGIYPWGIHFDIEGLGQRIWKG